MDTRVTRSFRFLEVLLLKMLLGDYLKSISAADRQKFLHGEQINCFPSRSPTQSDDGVEAYKYYEDVVKVVQKQVKKRLVEIGESPFQQFIQILRLSGYPEKILVQDDIFQTIRNAYDHLKSESERLKSIDCAIPDLLKKLDAYSKLLKAFDREIISVILQRLFIKEETLVNYVNETHSMSFANLSLVLLDLMQSGSFEFKLFEALGTLSLAKSEQDPLRLRSELQNLSKIVEWLSSDTRVCQGVFMKMLLTLAPDFIQFLEKTNVWKDSRTDMQRSFWNIYAAFLKIAQYVSKIVTQDDYATELQKFPSSGFPPQLRDILDFFRVNLLQKYEDLKPK